MGCPPGLCHLVLAHTSDARLHTDYNGSVLTGLQKYGMVAVAGPGL